MFSIDELLSKRNQRDALIYIQKKKDGQGSDGIKVSEFEEYWKLNHDMIEEAIRNQTYQPGIVMTYEIINGRGKRRIVSSLTVTDRFITRLLSQKIKRYIEPTFFSHSFAYQEGKGILEAVVMAQDYINLGDKYVVKIDIKDFFDRINLNRMLQLIKNNIEDEAVIHLLESYLYCKIEMNDLIMDKREGIVQGNSFSPVLSNWYLCELDSFMEENRYHWIRFADDIHIYTQEQEKASIIYMNVCEKIKNDLLLDINEQKSGIFLALEKTLLGYDFYKYGGKVEVRKHKYHKVDIYRTWHTCKISKVNDEYHIIKDGILNRQDFALLFENDKERHNIPVEALNQIVAYSDITISSAVLKMLAKNNIKLTVVDKYGNSIGCFLPEGYNKDAKTAIKQLSEYIDQKCRVEMARAFELAGIHNMRSNLRYYNKRKDKSLKSVIEELNRCIEEIRLVSSVEQLMLIEARARQRYYGAFNRIINNSDFIFVSRTKRPPKDEINAMISFGNTLLYNQILQQIWMTSLNPQIGIVHATNRRCYSLHLDFADLFKPIIVDRVIFSLIHRLQIKKTDFENSEDGAVLLSNNGKRIFVNAFNEKMNDKIVVKNVEYTYRNLILSELRKYQSHLFEKNNYKPYKYY